ncbi:hypothetical protein L6Q21_14070 [Sandaracinobacter sp. RS1-74]|uniref:hypothetical protein n=1 Tax=Sandaracinobacteroides sayramensis TaxID=2913411 RepID=UPI001EDA34E5|nr:hypothetical protein [Sandaracinobacteroides sayramensis]MCG2842111.1 hypothetical protein [Sandaracinobacteroides sayramensis]
MSAPGQSHEEEPLPLLDADRPPRARFEIDWLDKAVTAAAFLATLALLLWAPLGQ